MPKPFSSRSALEGLDAIASGFASALLGFAGAYGLCVLVRGRDDVHGLVLTGLTMALTVAVFIGMRRYACVALTLLIMGNVVLRLVT